MNIDFDKVRAAIGDGYISMQRRPTDDLLIYNYTSRAQFDGHWTDETINCRGLIANSRDEIIKRPFKKFFDRTIQ